MGGGGSHAHDLHHREPRGCQDHDHASGQHHARPAVPEARTAAGIEEGLLRVAVGLESVRDIQADLERGLN